MVQVVAVGVYVGSGTKIHFAGSVVEDREKFGRVSPHYFNASVYCGSERWGRGGFSGRAVAGEVGERMVVDDERGVAKWQVMDKEHFAQFVEKFGEQDVCQKCFKSHG